MLTLFSIPKPFVGHDGLIQRNAIFSWLALEPQPEVILLGREEGIEEVVREFKVGWIPDLARNEFGTPLLNDAFHQAAATARFPVLCYVNGDILFTKSLCDAVATLEPAAYLAVGRRTNIELTRPLTAAELRDPAGLANLAADGQLENPFAIDYFLFPAASGLTEIPEFAVGRPGWDNWMIYRAVSLRLPVIDLTAGVLALHQNHGYQHVPQRSGGNWEGPEADRNRRLVGNVERMGYSTLDASHHYFPGRGLVRARGRTAAWFKRLIADDPRLKGLLTALGLPWLRLERLRRRRMKKRGYPAGGL